MKANFIGREQEIVLFKKCLEAILPENQGRTEYENMPQILSFYGESGVGKTSLAKIFEELGHYERPFCFFSEKELNSPNIDFFYKRLEEHFSIPFYSLIEKGNTIRYNSNPFNTRILDDFFHIHYFKFPILIFDDCQNYPQFFNWFVSALKRNIHRSKFLVVFFSRFSLRIVLEKIEDKQLFHEQELKPFSFEESKQFLNGFFAQFSDDYLKKLYNYSKGKPEQLQFLIDLIKDKQIPAETVLHELILNEGKLITDFKEILTEKKELEKTQKIDVEMSVLGAMTHSLNHKFSYIKTDFENLKILIKKEKTEEDKNRLEEILDRLDNNISDAVITFDNAHKVFVKKEIDPQKTNLISLFEQEKKQFLGTTIHIEIFSLGQELEADIDQGIFRELILNLLNNAQKHAFTKDHLEPKIVFEITETQEIDHQNVELVPFIKIIYKDNGKGFPQDFNFSEYKKLASKAGRNKGSGIGGFWIDKIISLHHGKFRLKESDSFFKLQFEILIPVHYKIY